MAWQRIYDFQPGTKISSSQVDTEFDQLIDAVNKNQADILKNNSDIRGIAQLSKITADNGLMKLNVSATATDVLASLVALGGGLHTFYCIAGCVNNPTTNKPLRGIAHFTATQGNFGWVLATDSDGVMWTNYINNGAWKGWKSLGYDNLGSVPLWEGASMPVGATTITPTKKLSECRNGWILLWSDYDPPTSTEKDVDFVYSYIPKYSGTAISSKNHSFIVPNFSSDTTTNYCVKKIWVYDTKLVGHDDNASSTTGANDVVLRAVLEW